MARPDPERPVGGWKSLGAVTPGLETIGRSRTAASPLNGKSSPDASFHHARHRWLGLVIRDPELEGAPVRVAVMLWENMNAKRGYAWPSIAFMARELTLHRATVFRAIKLLEKRSWVTVERLAGRHRGNRYRIAFGTMD